MIWFLPRCQVWKRVWILEATSENGCEKWHFLVWNMVRIWRVGRHTPAKNSHEYFPGMYIRFLIIHVHIKNSYLVFILPILVFSQPESRHGKGRGGCSGFQVMGMIDGIFLGLKFSIPGYFGEENVASTFLCILWRKVFPLWNDLKRI